MKNNETFMNTKTDRIRSEHIGREISMSKKQKVTKDMVPEDFTGILGMVLMMVFAFKLDNADVKANWIEQLTNGIAQAAIFVGLLLLI